MKKLTIALFLALFLIPGVMAICEGSKITEGQVFLGLCNEDFGCAIDQFPESIQEGQVLTVISNLAFTADSPADNLFLEVGMYPKNSPQAFAVVFDSRNTKAQESKNCVEGETFVDTISVNHPGGNGEIASTFTIDAPQDADLNEGGEKQYVVQAVLYKNCYVDCADNFDGSIVATFTRPITLTADSKTVAVESDGVQSGDETDIDCGGSSGNACPLGYRCEESKDCSEGLACNTLDWGKVCTPKTTDNNVSALGLFTGTGLFLIGLLILILGTGYWFIMVKK